MKREEGLSILLAAENSFIRYYFSRLFEKRHSLRMTASGVAAISELSKKPYDLVFINEYLPDTGMAELLEAVGRCRPDAKSVVMLTHREDADHLIARHGAAGVMIKPFTVLDMLRLAERVLPAGASQNLIAPDALKLCPVMPQGGAAGTKG